jgi:hypothetical protein
MLTPFHSWNRFVQVCQLNITNHTLNALTIDVLLDSGDGSRWRGVCGEYAYRCSADLSLTAPCGEHRHFQRFARFVLVLHSVCANVFFSALVTLGLDIQVSDGPEQRRVNSFMRDYFFYIAGTNSSVCFFSIDFVKNRSPCSHYDSFSGYRCLPLPLHANGARFAAGEYHTGTGGPA